MMAIERAMKQFQKSCNRSSHESDSPLSFLALAKVTFSTYTVNTRRKSTCVALLSWVICSLPFTRKMQE